MTDSEIHLRAKQYIDSALGERSAPSSEAYEAAVGKVEDETRKLVAIQEQKRATVAS